MVESEAIYKIHMDESFQWSYTVRGNPEFPEIAKLIEVHEENELVSSISVNVKAIPLLIEALQKTMEKS